LLVNSYATGKEYARKQLRENKLLVNSYALFLGGRPLNFQRLMSDGCVIQVEHEFYLFLDPERSGYIFPGPL